MPNSKADTKSHGDFTKDFVKNQLYTVILEHTVRGQKDQES